MAQKKIEIIYDIDGKAIDVAIQSTLNLQQQAKALTAELRKTKEGTAEFTLLTSKLNDAKDGLDRVNAKSRDLFAALSLLPGPVGSFFGQLNGAIGLMKTFTSFSVKDLGNQFKELNNDIKDIYQQIGNLFKGSTDLDSANKETAKSTKELGQESAGTAANLVNLDKVSKDVSKSVQELDSYYKFNIQTNKGFAAGLGFLAEKMDATITTNQKYKNGLNETTYTITQTNGQVQTLTKSEMLLKMETEGVTKAMAGTDVVMGKTDKSAAKASKSFGVVSGVLKLVGLEAYAAATAVTVLDMVLNAIGIGLLIAALAATVGYLIEATTYLYKMATGVLAAEEATKKLTTALDEQEIALDKNVKAQKRFGNEKIALLKAQGASEEKIRKAGIENLYKERDLSSKALGETIDVIKKLQANRGKNDEENNKQIERALKKKRDLEEQYKDLSSQIKVSDLNNQSENNKKLLENQKKADEEAKKLRDKRLQDNKAADEALLTLKQENSVLYLKNERDKQYKELQNQAENEARKIESLDISEKKKEEIRLQIYKKYGAKMIELANKFNEEDEKKSKEKYDKQLEFDKKLADMAIQAISDQAQREKAEKQKKYDDDEAELKKALSEDLITQKEYDNAILNLKKALNNDLKKIDDDNTKREKEAKLKKLDEDIRFLQLQVDFEKNTFVAYYTDRQKLLDLSKQKELAAEELTGAQKAAIEKKYVQLSKDLQREKFEAYVAYLGQGLAAAQSIMAQQSAITNQQQQLELDDLQLAFNKQQEFNAKTITNKEEFDKQTLNNERELALQQDKVKEEYFYKNREAQKSQAMISAFQAAISAYSSLAAIPVVGPFLGAAAAAVALAFGIKQANLIGQQKYVSSVPTQGPEASSSSSSGGGPNYGRNYADGGMIGGNRHSDGGTMIEAERGEAIMTRGAVTMFQPMLSMMNQMGGGTSFAPSLVSTSYDNPKISNTAEENKPMIIKSYVVSGELTSEANKQARLKDLSTI